MKNIVLISLFLWSFLLARDTIINPFNGEELYNNCQCNKGTGDLVKYFPEDENISFNTWVLDQLLPDPYKIDYICVL